MSGKIVAGVFGAGGRMGQEVLAILRENEEISLGAALESSKQGSGFQILKNIKSKLDVMIDFSSPQGTEEVAQWCADQKVPLVTGTTGLSAAQEEILNQGAKKIPVLASANMSLGINSLIQALKAYCGSFNEGEVSIVEVHHKYKKDKPSGTAKLLHKTLQGELKKPVVVSDPVSLRGGDVFGIHKVYFFSEGEWVCFEHQATGRSVFARGAVKAALWLAQQKPGLYSMADFISAGRGR